MLCYIWFRLLRHVQLFYGLKLALSSAPVLALPNIDVWYEVVCDASGFGCGSVATPEACGFLQLNDAQQRSAPGEQDLQAMVMGAEAMAVLPRGCNWWPDSGK